MATVNIRLVGMTEGIKRTVGKAMLEMYKADDRFNRFEWEESFSRFANKFMLSLKASLNNGERINLEMRYNADEANAEEGPALNPYLYANSDLIVFIYDVGSRESFERVNHWLANLGQVCAHSII
jgi:hypothetical protein